MNRYERILETLKCPCGGEVKTKDYTHVFMVQCKRCFGTANGASILDALIAWLILTGGPIDGSIEPPFKTWRHYLDHGDDDHAYGLQRVDGCRYWWLPADERTEPVLRPWLTEAIDE